MSAASVSAYVKDGFNNGYVNAESAVDEFVERGCETQLDAFVEDVVAQVAENIADGGIFDKEDLHRDAKEAHTTPSALIRAYLDAFGSGLRQSIREACQEARRGSTLGATCWDDPRCGLYGFGNGYEESPATRLLATHCAVCARPLVEATSVETGIGPVCAAKYGMDQSCDPAARAEANRLVYLIAAHQTSMEAAQAAARLRELGFERLSAIVMERIATVHIEDVGGTGYKVAFRYDPAAVEDIKRVAGRRWVKDEKVWYVPRQARNDLFVFLKRNFAGQILMGPKGPFTV